MNDSFDIRDFLVWLGRPVEGFERELEIPYFTEMKKLLAALHVTQTADDAASGDHWLASAHVFAGDETDRFNVLIEIHQKPDEQMDACTEGLRVVLQNTDGTFWLLPAELNDRGQAWFKNLPFGRYNVIPDESRIQPDSDKLCSELHSHAGSDSQTGFIDRGRLRNHLSEKKDLVGGQIARLLVPQDMWHVIELTITLLRDSRESQSRGRNAHAAKLRAAAFSSGGDKHIQEIVDTVGRVLEFVDQLCAELIQQCSSVEDIANGLDTSIEKSMEILTLKDDLPLLANIRNLVASGFLIPDDGGRA